MDQPETNVPETKSQTKFRACTFTFYGQDEILELPDGVSYLCYGKEICPTTGKKHLQGFAYAPTQKRWTAWKKIFGTNHFEQAQAENGPTQKELAGEFAKPYTAIGYCMKDGDFHELGERPMANGKKRTLQALCESVTSAVETAVPLSSVVTQPEHQATFVQYNNGIQKLHNMLVTEKMRKIEPTFTAEIIFIRGPSAKTRRYAYKKHPGLYSIAPYDQYKWKDGYSGEDAVLYADICPKNICIFTMLRELDKYFIHVPVKGGVVGWRPRVIYLTSLQPLENFDDRIIERVTKKFDLTLKK